MKRISVSVFGEKCEELVFNWRSKEQALAYIERAIQRGDSISIDVIEIEDPATPEYLKDYASI